MKSWLIIAMGLFTSWHFIDLASDSFVQGTVWPISFSIFLIALLIKIATKIASGHNHQGNGDGGGGGFWGGDGGGDGGC